ncbi:hypothetical protein N665_0787s0027 [Sinapis alba]|nr:hypothetical protein N665_0787s0027 [Sinapis alba]
MEDATFPVRHRKFSLESKVIATQFGAMGTLLQARKEEGMSVEPTFSVSVIFGKRDEPMLIATARRLIDHISSFVPSKPLVLSLGLKEHSSETLKEIVAAVIENRLWYRINEKMLLCLYFLVDIINENLFFTPSVSY